MASVNIVLNVGESREITALHWMSHHRPASYYSCRGHTCRSEPFTIKTPAILLSTITMVRSLRATVTNLRHTTATQRVRKRTQKPSWCEKAGYVWRKIFGDTKLTMGPPLKPPWIDTGTHTFRYTIQMTVDTASGNAIAVLTLVKE